MKSKSNGLFKTGSQFCMIEIELRKNRFLSLCIAFKFQKEASIALSRFAFWLKNERRFASLRFFNWFLTICRFALHRFTKKALESDP